MLNNPEQWWLPASYKAEGPLLPDTPPWMPFLLPALVSPSHPCFFFS